VSSLVVTIFMDYPDYMSRFSKTFTTLESTLFHVADYWFTKDPSRVQDIRADALGLPLCRDGLLCCLFITTARMLSLANVHPDGRYLVVDDGGGIVVAGVLERLGGQSSHLLYVALHTCISHFLS
jgi:tRNA (adenine58-N1)-methyltransferase non-catalytic subunit